MAVPMGILCEACGKVHFIATSSGVELSRSGAGMYRLTCKPPCTAITEFRKNGMRPYRVSDDVFSRGYAEVSEYELVGGRFEQEHRA
jgi:hypothetical protein